MAKLRGGTKIGGYLALHYGNFRDFLSRLTSVTLTGDVTGSAQFDENGLLSITTAVATIGGAAVQVTQAANTIPKRDSGGNLSTNLYLYFSNDDGFYYDDTANVMYARLDGANHKLWHQGNDGHNSGLDADVLDGLHGSQLLRNDIVDQKVSSYLTIKQSGSHSVLEMENASGVEVAHYYTLNTTAANHEAGIGVFSSTGMAGGRKDFILRYDGTILWNGNKVWHAGNDGPASGLNADLLDGYQAANFLRSDAGDTFSGGVLVVKNTASDLISKTGEANTIQVRQDTAGKDAFMSFHVAGDYAVHFGLDGATNDLSVGGWSKGAVKYKVWHAGNDGAGSGLDADLLDGLQSTKFMRTDVNSGGDSIQINVGSILFGQGECTINATQGGIEIVGGGGVGTVTIDPGLSAITFDGKTVYDSGNLGTWQKNATAPSGTTRLNYHGYLYATRVYNAVWNDYADFFEMAPGEKDAKPGDVLIKTKEGLKVHPGGGPTRKTQGVFSDTYGMANGADEALDDKGNLIYLPDGTLYKAPVGVAGIVPVWIENPSEEMEEGDLIVAGNERGKARVNNDITGIGFVIGKLFETEAREDGRYWMTIMLA